MINKFLDYISVEKRYSQNTLVSYKKDLEDLLLFISETEGTEDLKKVDKKIIRNFIVSLSEKKIQKRSINRKLSSLRSFYLYLLKIGEIQVSPLETIPSLKFYAEKQKKKNILSKRNCLISRINPKLPDYVRVQVTKIFNVKNIIFQIGILC